MQFSSSGKSPNRGGTDDLKAELLHDLALALVVLDIA
jgi:hypothetical protein